MQGDLITAFRSDPFHPVRKKPGRKREGVLSTKFDFSCKIFPRNTISLLTLVHLAKLRQCLDHTCSMCLSFPKIPPLGD